MNKLKCRNLENFGQLNESQQMMASVWRVPPPTSIFSYFRHCKHLSWAMYCIVLYLLFFNCGLSFLLAQYLYLCYLFGFSFLSSVRVMFKTLSPSPMPGAILPSWSCSPYLMHFNPSAWALYFVLSLFFMAFQLARHFFFCYQLISSPLYTYSDGL